MEADAKVYESLAAHLNTLPAGFPRTPGGVELRILKRLFTAEEARLAQLVTMRPESAAQVARRTGQDVAELAPRLDAMSRRGLIFRMQRGSETLFMAAQFVVGIWEYHVNDLDPDLIRDVNEYLPYFFADKNRTQTPQLRTIPISRALTAEQRIMPYEAARQIIAAQEAIAVAPCICRREHHMVGKGCDRPLESCLVFGAAADYYEENGLARRIDATEALAILEAAEEAGLVLQPSNSQKVVNICTCCGCCCQILKNLQRLPCPADYVASNFLAAVDRDLCVGCGVCVERCQMGAIEVRDGVAEVLLDRCIGCGLCVPTCDTEAVRLEPKTADKRREPPIHIGETYLRIARERQQPNPR
jgi:NAD-dependent dihydropyrimidine dehydrogenase PreA subunit